MSLAPRVPAALMAFAVFLLALLSPATMADSDPGIALLASQALAQHGTLDLRVYADDPRCAYDLAADYRVKKRRDGALRFYSIGLPVFGAPAVLLANALGYDMLDRRQELALQNLLSALVCALLFLLLFVVAAQEAGPWPGLVIATVSTLGSSLISTLATGLWNIGPAMMLVCLALLVLHRPRSKPLAATLAALLVIGAFFIRPSLAIAGLALLLARIDDRKRAFGALAFLAASLGMLLASDYLVLLDRIPAYYRNRELVLPDPFWSSLQGLLVSPSRGLLVFSPFLLPVLVATLTGWRSLWRKERFRVSVYWVALLLPAVAFKPIWWGGHSYGPRMLAELMPALVLITAMLWQDRYASRPWRSSRWWAMAYLGLAIPAIGIHSGQGLFNPEVRRWNEVPNIDRHTSLLFDWHHPQFLADAESLAERSEKLQERRLARIGVGETIAFDDARVIFVDWSEPESSWRWSGARQVALVFLLEDVDETLGYTLEVVAGALGRQAVHAELNDLPIGIGQLSGPEPRSMRLEAPPFALRNGKNRLRFDLPAATSIATDRRTLGVSLRSIRWIPATSP